jgi:hypothetical protein
MSDKEARVLGAGSTIEVNGKEFKILPIGMQQLHEIQRAAVEYYKREYLSTYSKNFDLLPKDHAAQLLERKFDEAAKWDVGDLPIKLAYSVRSVPLNEKLVALLEEEYGELPDGETGKRAVLATALDTEKINSKQVEKLTGARPQRARVPYDTWWVTALYDGMITFVWTSLKQSHPEVTKEIIGNWPLSKIVEAARLVEEITAPALGNT